MIKKGMRVRFVPGFVPGALYLTKPDPSEFVTGKVIYINREHKYFTVEFFCGNTTQLESFKFFQIGKSVKICG